MEVDPLASMRVWAVELELGGRTFEVPALPALDWFLVLMEADVISVLDLIEDSSDLDDMIITGGVSASKLIEVLTSVVEQATGRSAHAAFTLVQAARLQWPVVGGELARRGFRWDQASIGAALDAIYTTLAERMKTEHLTRFQTLLDNNPMSPVETRSGRRVQRDRGKAMAAFEDMAGPRPTPQPVPASAARSAGARSKTPQRRQRRRPAGR